MKIIIDANIVFSGILNTKSKIGDLLINSHKNIQFIAPDFLRNEIHQHYNKIAKLTGLSIEQIIESEYHICKNIYFISDLQIPPDTFHYAYNLVKNIDPKDSIYIAFAEHFHCKIWSGDQKLIRGLAKKKYHEFISTNELFNYREAIKLKLKPRRK